MGWVSDVPLSCRVLVWQLWFILVRVGVILLREQIMHDRWRCHKNMNWNLLEPLQFGDTHLWCVSIYIALQLTTQFFKIHQAIRCCFVVFFSEDTWDSSDHELFQIWVTWPTTHLEKIHVCHPAKSNHESSKRAGALGGESSKEPENGGSEDANVGRFWRFWFGIWKTWSFTNKSPGTRCSVEKIGSSGCFLMTSGTWKDVGKNCWYLCCR